MSELAYNADGIQFQVPAGTAAWRVRKCKKKKGAPEVMYGRDGIPLVIAVDATIEDLRTEVSEPGKYRLDPLDEEQRPIANATPAYVMVPEALVPNADLKGEMSPPVDAMAAVLQEVMRANIEANRGSLALGQTIVERFAGVMESAAVLVRAVGGVPALPAAVVAEPAALAEAVEGDEESQEAAPQGLDLNALVAQVVTSVVTAVCNGQMRLPALGSLLDWRKATPAAAAPTAQEPTSMNAPSNTPAAASSSTTATAPRSASAASNASSDTPPVAGSAMALAALSPAAMGQLMAVQQALAPEERALALAVIRELPPSELQVWVQELARLPLDAAVARIRTVLHSKPEQTAGGVS